MNKDAIDIKSPKINLLKTQLEQRRNGFYTCLDCMYLLSNMCFTCKVWEKFEVDSSLSNATYEQKNKNYELKKNHA